MMNPTTRESKETRKLLNGARSQVRIAIDAVKEAAERLTKAGLMPSVAETLTEVHSSLAYEAYALLVAMEAAYKHPELQGTATGEVKPPEQCCSGGTFHTSGCPKVRP